MNIKGSKTEINLYKTFAGESRARNKYSLYAEKARCEGYRWVAEIFEETSENEKAHARETFSRYLKKNKSTELNLIDSAMGEADESKSIYKEFENMARKEGFEEIADFYKELQEVEEMHGKRFLKLANEIKNGDIFSGDEESLWQCMNCGYIHEGKDAPKECPLCKYPISYFKPYCKID
jgi:rubrerythrin